MRSIAALALGVAALAATGCLVPSLEPLYTDKELVTDSGLVGLWQEENGKDLLLIRERDAGGYVSYYFEEDKVAEAFELRLVQLGKLRFYDLFPESKSAATSLGQCHYIPAHTFGIIARDGDRLRTDPLNADWMKDALKQNPALIAHKDYDGPALIASTPELQKFALKFAAGEKAFPKGQTWIRRP